MKSYASALKGEEGMVKQQKYIENFYKEEYEKTVKALEKKFSEVEYELNLKKAELQKEKDENAQKSTQIKSLSDQNAALRKQTKEQKDKIKQMEDERENMVHLNYSAPTETIGQTKRHIELD